MAQRLQIHAGRARTREKDNSMLCALPHISSDPRVWSRSRTVASAIKPITKITADHLSQLPVMNSTWPRLYRIHPRPYELRAQYIWNPRLYMYISIFVLFVHEFYTGTWNWWKNMCCKNRSLGHWKNLQKGFVADIKNGGDSYKVILGLVNFFINVKPIFPIWLRIELSALGCTPLNMKYLNCKNMSPEDYKNFQKRCVLLT